MPDIPLNALQVLFWGSIGIKRYELLCRLYSSNITQNEALSFILLLIFAFHAL